MLAKSTFLQELAQSVELPQWAAALHENAYRVTGQICGGESLKAASLQRCKVPEAVALAMVQRANKEKRRWERGKAASLLSHADDVVCGR